MNLDKFRTYCLSRKGATEDFPFDDTTMTFRVGEKMFALIDIESTPFRFNLKCDPERALELREEYECIKPGWHMNKKHWNTVVPDDTIDDAFVYELIDHSYDLIFSKLKKSVREEILALED